MKATNDENLLCWHIIRTDETTDGPGCCRICPVVSACSAANRRLNVSIFTIANHQKKTKRSLNYSTIFAQPSVF